MAKHLTGIDFCKAADCARRIAESAIVAYYMERPASDEVKYHYLHMRYELDRLCEVMGLRIVDADEAAPLNVATASAAAMIPMEEV